MSKIELLEKVIIAHGGLERWKSIHEINVRTRLGGLLFLSRVKPFVLRRVEFSLRTDKPNIILNSFPSRGYRGIFEIDSVRVESDDGSIIHERRDPRLNFNRFRTNFYWDILDAIYFVGYASWNYLCTPFIFLLPGFEIEELEPWYESGEKCNRLKVIFPSDFPTHCLEQIFYFNSDGFLKRHDYTAEVVGNWAKAAHYCFDHKNFSGLIVPTKRRVFPRWQNNNSLPIANIVSIDIEDIFIS